MKNRKKNKQLKKKKDRKLKELREMAEEHFRTLAPAHKRGNLLKYAYIQNYENLGYTLESILNVCIMGLDEYAEYDPKRYIKEGHKQFADVLEFAKNLIPHEEFEFLDKSRRLLLENDDR